MGLTRQLLLFRRAQEERDFFDFHSGPPNLCDFSNDPPVEISDRGDEKPKREEGSVVFFVGACVILGDGLLALILAESRWSAPEWMGGFLLVVAVATFVMAALTATRLAEVARVGGPFVLSSALFWSSLAGCAAYCGAGIAIWTFLFALAFTLLGLNEVYGWTE